ncbi:endonuclease/exonuclease/phosphatase family protein [Pseudonocardia humida]|uniref:Endonuclease/exonuclease/phosphatase family protein n=1 Tax=Pseudonocardia humida TaxID=2800819 RepID=A0ABT0ZV00_9PSEU|nr:endonuclease/exonuclease/phosphatase family protein [Pseudonocardia humida]MCO1654549.1 endonuclease/exonuclease/phosphatase family protein [Pseudonocardia humida]
MTAPPGQLRPAAPRHRRPRPRRRLRPGAVLAHVAALLCTLAFAGVALPDLLGLDRRTPFVQLLAFRPWTLVGGLGAALVLAMVWRFVRPVRPFVAPLLAGVVAVVLVGAAMVLPRVVPDPLPTTGTPLTVLAFNTFEGHADPAALAALVAEQRPDLVSIPEAGEDYRVDLAPLVEPLGYRVEASTDAEDVNSVTALVSERLGDVTFRTGDEPAYFPYVEATGGELGDLRFVAYHAAAPLRGQLRQWEGDLALLSRWCTAATPAIVAGDLNATLDHSALRSGMAGCSDAADQRGEGLVPTWSPTDRTQLFGPQIDHVLSTAGIAAETFTVHDVEGSDHRAVVTRLRLP